MSNVTVINNQQVGTFKGLSFVDVVNGEYAPLNMNVIAECKHLITSIALYKSLEISLFCNDTRTKTIKGTMAITRIKENTLLEAIGVKEAEVLVKGVKKEMDLDDKFQDTIIKVNKQKRIVNVLDRRTDGKLYISLVYGEICIYEKDSCKFVCINSEEKTEYDVLDFTFSSYSFGYYTTGSIKKDSAFYIKDVTDLRTLIKENWNGMYLTYSALDKMSEDKARTTVGRLSLMITGNKKFISTKSIAMYDGKLGDMNVNGKVVNGANGTADGLMIANNEFIQYALRLNSPEKAMQFVMQVRIEEPFIGKGQLQARSKEYNSLVLETLYQADKTKLRLYGVELKDGWDATVESRREVFNNINLLVDKDTVKAGGEHEIVKDVEEITLNILAIKFEPSIAKIAIQTLEKVYYYAALKYKQDGIDELDKYFQNCFESEVTEMIDNLFKPGNGYANLDTKYSQDIVREITPRLTPVSSYRRVLDMQNSITNIINKMGLSLKHENGMPSSLTAVLCCDISSLIIYKGLIKDNEVFFGEYANTFYEYEQQYGVDSKEYKELVDSIIKAIVFRYPSLELDEKLPVRFLTFEEIDERLSEKINSGEIDEYVANVLNYEFFNTSRATIMLAPNSILFKILGGADIDFDKVNIVTDKMYIKMLFEDGLRKHFEVSTVAPGTPKNDKEKEELKVKEQEYNTFVSKMNDLNKSKKSNKVEFAKTKTYDALSSTFYKDMYNFSYPHEGEVGPITNKNTMIVALLTECRLGNCGPAKNFIKALIGSEGVRNKVLNVKHFNDDGVKLIDEVYVELLFEQMNNVKWTDTNIIIFLEECNKISQLYQMSNIDGAKTGYYIDSRISIETIVIGSLCKVQANPVKGERFYKLERVLPDNVGKTVEVVTYDKNKFTDRVRYYVGIIGKLQDKFIDFTNNVVTRFIKDNADKFNYSELEITEFEKVIGRVVKLNDVEDGFGTKTLDDLYTIKALYQLYSNDYREKRAEVDPKDDNADMLFAELKEEFNEEIQPLRISAMRILSNLTFSNNPREDLKLKGTLALALSVWNYNAETKTYEYIPSSTNKFGYNVLPEYVYAYYTDGSDTYTAKAKIIQNDSANVLDRVELVDGMNKDFMLFTNSRYTGEVIVGHDGYVYAHNTFEVDEVVDNGESLLIIDKDIINDKLVSKDNKCPNFLKTFNKSNLLRVDEEGVLLSPTDKHDFLDAGEEYMFDGELDVDYKIVSATEAFISVPAQLNRDKKQRIDYERRFVYILNLKEVE